MLDAFKWDWFGTYTLNMQARPETAHSMFRNHLAFLEKHAHLPVYAFRGDEYGVLYGRYHIHALLGNVGEFPAFCRFDNVKLTHLDRAKVTHPFD